MTKGINENIDQSSSKYNIIANFEVSGVVEVQDVVGALFGQTEGLLSDLELRELQKSGRIGRIVVSAASSNGITSGEIIIPSSLDRTETAILAATLETVDRVGPCKAAIKLIEIRDLRESKLKQIEARAKELLKDWKAGSTDKEQISDKILKDLEKESIITWNGLPAGSEVASADNVIIVEGRNDIQQLLKIGVKNTIAVNGTSVPKQIIDLTHTKDCTAFLDGDRGGTMILNELLQVSKIKFVARAPYGKEVEELSSKEMVKCLQGKKPVEVLLRERKNKDSRNDQRGQRRNGKAPYVKQDRYPARKSTSRGQKSHRPASALSLLPKDFINLIKESVKNLISSNEAIGLDDKNAEVLKTSNVKVFNEMNGNISTLLLDGVVSQRFIDKILEKHIKKVVAVNYQYNLRIPKGSEIELYYFKEFV
jgi:DNA primase